MVGVMSRSDTDEVDSLWELLSAGASGKRASLESSLPYLLIILPSGSAQSSERPEKDGLHHGIGARCAGGIHSFVPQEKRHS